MEKNNFQNVYLLLAETCRMLAVLSFKPYERAAVPVFYKTYICCHYQKGEDESSLLFILHLK